MDRRTAIPENEGNHDVYPLFVESFQDHLCSYKFPLNVAKNLQKYTLFYIRQNQENRVLEVLQHCREAEDEIEYIATVERKLMNAHAKHLMNADEIKKHPCLLEKLRLKIQQLKDEVTSEELKKYTLVTTADLFPDVTKKYLDFRFNPELHTCTESCDVDERARTETGKEAMENPKHIEQSEGKAQQRKLAKCQTCGILEAERKKSCFLAQPNTVRFEDYKPEIIYKRKIKLLNTSRSTQSFTFSDFSRDSPLQVRMLSETKRLAPGMYAEFVIIFKPKIYRNIKEKLIFKSDDQGTTTVAITCTRTPPKLACFVYNVRRSIFGLLQGPANMEMSKIRWKALNFTIDLGACLLGSYQLYSFIMKNEGQDGKFFVTTEQEWFFEELEERSARPCDLQMGDFCIFPTYFEIKAGEVVEFFILFVPQQCGLQTEKVVLICDNNTTQGIDIIGECVNFNQGQLQINLYTTEKFSILAQGSIQFTREPFSPVFLVLSVNNESSLYLNYRWVVEPVASPESKPIEPDWFSMLNDVKELMPCTVSDFIVQLMPKTDEAGIYASELSLYLTEIPLLSILTNYELKEKDATKDCACIASTEKLEDIAEKSRSYSDLHVKTVDVFICKLNLICKIESTPEVEIISESECTTTCYSTKSKVTPTGKLGVEENFLNFGLLPKGVRTSKTFTIRNKTNENLRWKLVEVLCKPGLKFITLDDLSHLSRSCGSFNETMKRFEITYTVDAQEPCKHISLILLLSFPPEEYTILDFSLCLVTYQVFDIDVSVFPEDGDGSPLICPKEVLYINMPYQMRLCVRNNNKLAGGFYFLKPAGICADNFSIKVQPQSGILKPLSTTLVNVEIIPHISGIFEEVYLPYFVGDKDHIASVELICVVSDICVNFYLPDSENGYLRIPWPETNRPDYSFPMVLNEDHVLKPEDHPTIADEKSNSKETNTLWELITSESVAATYPTIEIKNVAVRQHTQVKLFCENVSSLHGNFAVRCINYGTDDQQSNEAILIKCGVKSQKQCWENHCTENSGIVVEPGSKTGDIYPNEVIAIDLSIYATTWGTYLEEVMIEIYDLVPFCFNLIIDVVGFPLEVPYGVKHSIEEPILRFGCIAYGSKPVEKLLKVINISCLPIETIWHIFNHKKDRKARSCPFNVVLDTFDGTGTGQTLNLFVSHEYYGEEKQVHFDINPTTLLLDRRSSVMMKVTFNCHLVKPRPDKIFLEHYLIGYAHLSQSDSRFKENYYRRRCGVDLKPLKVKILAEMELPELVLESDNDKTQFDILANDLLVSNCDRGTKSCLMLKNNSDARILCGVKIDRPFIITSLKTTKKEYEDVDDSIEIKRGQCLEIDIKFDITTEELMNVAEMTYSSLEDGAENATHSEKCYTYAFKRFLRINHQQIHHQMVPLHVRLHYPRVKVRPDVYDFGPVLLFNTKKTIISIYNMSGSPVQFEIYKTSVSEDFVTRPAFGEIPASTGTNRQFVDVALYFTPKEIKLYQEIIKVQTNIPCYAIDVSVCGKGSNDEKFCST